MDIEALVNPAKRKLAQAKQEAQALFALCAAISGLAVTFVLLGNMFRALVNPPPLPSMVAWLPLSLISGWLAVAVDSSPRSAVRVIPYWIVSLLLATGISYIRGQLSLFFLVTAGVLGVVGFVLGERINRLAA